jgi:hypothetical protein
MTTPFNLSAFANALNANGQSSPSSFSDQGNTSTGALGLPIGTTAQRPVSPANGYTRINSTTNVIETYYSGTWNTVYTFTLPVTPSVEYLVVAGGGAGGTDPGSAAAAGGGGAGGYLTSTGFAITAGVALTVTVGAGATATNTNTKAANGSDSVFSTITATGGGSAYTYLNSTSGSRSGSGGSGAGGTFSRLPGLGTVGQGNDGGAPTTNGYSGGGGGAGAVGQDAVFSPPKSGNGGVGLQSSISGTATFYAGGGGGGWTNTALVNGGGGQGSELANGGAGTANSGGGGGGGGINTGNFGGNGGSGVVILRYADTYPAATSTTGSPTITVAGGYRVYKFTASGSITF